MKLSTLNEDDGIQQLARAVGRSYGIKPRGNPGSTSMSGLDRGARALGNTSMPSGIPSKPRHRRYFSIVPPGVGM